MKKIVFSLIALTVVLSACSNLTENEARTKLNNEAQTLSVTACDCIKNLSSEGDQLIEEHARCRGVGQSALYDLGHEEGIDDLYPAVVEDAEQKYFELVDNCAN